MMAAGLCGRAGAAETAVRPSTAAAAGPPSEGSAFDDFQAIGLRGGAVFPFGGLRGTAGSVVAFDYVHQLSARFGLGVSVDSMKFAFDPTVRSPSSSTGVARRDVSALITLRYAPIRWKLASPVLLGGVGMHYWDTAHGHTLTERLDQLDPKRKHRSFGWKPTAMVGTGLFGRYFDFLVWDVTLRYHYLPEPKEFRVSAGSGPGQALAIGAMVGFEI